MLLKRGAWADAADTVNGDTAMHYAVRCSGDGGAACVQLLVAKGAAMTVTNNAGLSALDAAALAGDARMVALMQRLNLEVPRLLRSSEPVRGTSLLHAAAALGADAGVKLLLEYRGVDVNGREAGKGYTPLMMACANNRGSRTLRIARRLLRAGADPRCVSEATGETAWSLAAPGAGAAGSRGMLCELLREWGAQEAGGCAPARGAARGERSELDEFRGLDGAARDRLLLRWCGDPATAPFDAEQPTWKKAAADFLNFHHTSEDFALVGALRADRDFQEDIGKKHTRQAIDAITADPAALSQWQTHKSAMRVLSKLRRLKSYGMGKGARFPLEYFVVAQMPDDKFRQKEENVAKCRSIAAARAAEEAECLLIALKPEPADGGESAGATGGPAGAVAPAPSSIPPIVGQVLQAVAGPLMALLVTYVMMRRAKVDGGGAEEQPGEGAA